MDCHAANEGGGQGSRGAKTPQEMDSGGSPPSWWRGLGRGAAEVDDEAEGGGGGGAAAFGEELEVFSSALRKDFEVKVRLRVVDYWRLEGAWSFSERL